MQLRSPQAPSRTRRMLDAIRQRRSDPSAQSLLPLSHVAQMRLFMLRQGVEWYADQDSFGQRRRFIARVVRDNRLATRMPAIIDNLMLDGKGLLFFRPSKDLYRILYFTKQQFRTYYDEEGDLEEVWITYQYKVRPRQVAMGFGANAGAPSSVPAAPQDRWFLMVVRKDVIFQRTTEQPPDLDSGVGAVVPELGWQKIVNTLGFIPAVEVYNERGLEDGSSSGEFDLVESFIDQHDKLSRNIRNNLNFYGNPTLVSSRPKSDLVEPDGDGERRGRNSVAANSGFRSAERGSSRDSDPWLEAEEGVRVPRVIANVDSADRVGYITPDGVSGDQINFEQRYMESIRSVLGGVDDLSISSGATAYEVRTLFGRVAATAKRKCVALYDFGFGVLFSMMIFHEEELFRQSLAAALGLPKPPPLLIERAPAAARAQAQQQQDQLLATWNQLIDRCIEQIRATGEAPPGLVGLIPDGDASVSWRFMGEVFEDSAQDLLQHSIICRNLQELGVGSIEALGYLFPNKTPEERSALLSGYPFRQAEATQRSIGIYVDLLRAMMQVPHPQEPDLPLAADPGLDLVPYLYRTLDYLRQELSYTASHQDVNPAAQPVALSDADRYRAQLGLPTDDQRRRDTLRAAFSQQLARHGLGAPGGQLSGGAAGVSGADVGSPLPGLGGTLSYDPAGPYPGATAQLGGPGGTGGGSYGLSVIAGRGPADPGGTGGQPPDRRAAATGGRGASGPGPDQRRPGPGQAGRRRSGR